MRGFSDRVSARATRELLKGPTPLYWRTGQRMHLSEVSHHPLREPHSESLTQSPSGSAILIVLPLKFPQVSGVARVRLADLNGPKWTKMDHFGPFWCREYRRFDHFGPFWSSTLSDSTANICPDECFQGSSQGDWHLSKICIKLSEDCPLFRFSKPTQRASGRKIGGLQKRKIQPRRI